MPRLNLFLNADVALDTDQILFNQSLLAPEPKLGTKAQRKALHCILSNVAKYRSQPLLYSTRNQANPPEQYNPHGYGHKPLVAVIKQLRNNGMLKLESGTPWYTKTEQGDFKEPKLSAFAPNENLIKLCEELGYTEASHKGATEHFIELRSLTNKLLPFEPTPYSRHIEQLMSAYCAYLNLQDIKIDGENLGHIHLIRKYRDRDGSGRLIYGGRTHHPFMSFPKAKRKKITINGESVVAVDYPASQANVLYKYMTGEFLHPEDPYKVDGLHRDTVKHLMQMMLNNGSRKGASMAAKANLTSLKKSAAQAFDLDLQKHRAVATMLRLVEERNAPIAECFYQGKARGQYYAWLESNLVFEVAKYLTDQGVPALTVHDEFIVPESMESAVLECRYKVPLFFNTLVSGMDIKISNTRFSTN